MTAATLNDERVRQLAQLIRDHVHHVHQEFPDGVQPADGSPGARELGEARGLSPEWELACLTAVNIGSLMVTVSVDHLEALAKVLEPPMPLWGFSPPARSAVETASVGHWLLEPGLGLHERVARSLAVRLESAHREAQVVAAVNGEAVDGAKEGAVRAEATALGVAIPKVPTPTKRAGDVLADHASSRQVAEGVYTYLSGQSHGAIYTAVQRFREVGPGTTELRRGMAPNLDVKGVQWTVMAALGANTSVVTRAIAYAGTDDWAWQRWRVKVAVDLKAQAPSSATK